MRTKQILVIILVLVVTMCFAEEQQKGYEVTELAENLYKLTVDGGGYVVSSH